MGDIDLSTRPVENGVIYVSPEELKDYIHSPRREFLMLQSGIDLMKINKQRSEMLAGHREVTYKKFLVKVREG